MNQSNLPSWPGASVCYSRAMLILQKRNGAAYAAWHANPKRKKRDRWSPDEESAALVVALDKGDEEAIKAACYTYRDLWLEA